MNIWNDLQAFRENAAPIEADDLDGAGIVVMLVGKGGKILGADWNTDCGEREAGSFEKLDKHGNSKTVQYQPALQYAVGANNGKYGVPLATVNGGPTVTGRASITVPLTLTAARKQAGKTVVSPAARLKALIASK